MRISDWSSDVCSSDLVSNKKAFGLGLPGCLHLRHTQLPDHKFEVGQPETGAELAEDLQRFVDLHGPDSIACCIVEPIAGSTGALIDRKSVVEGKRVSVRVDLGGRRIIKKKNKK